MLIPQRQDLVGLRGVTFDVLFEVWQDEAQTIPYDYVALGYAATLEVDDMATYPTTAPTPGQVLVRELGNVTSTWTRGNYRYRLRLTNTSNPNDSEVPVNGYLSVREP